MGYKLIPKKLGSKAKKHTLIFRPGNWVILPIKNENTKIKKYSGFIIDTIDFKLQEVKNLLIDNNYFIHSDFCIKLDDNNIITKEKAIINTEISNIIDWFSPSIHKSLIQKLIRTKCEFVSHLGKNYKSIDFYIQHLVCYYLYQDLLFHLIKLI